jgi:CheY-like chemotaxis protein
MTWPMTWGNLFTDWRAVVDIVRLLQPMAAQLPLAGLSILVIDDHRDTVDMLVEYLQSVGATVLGAGSAKAGLAFIETHLLDAVLVDLRMPGDDGRWFLRQVRSSATPGVASVPVFALSGDRHDEPDPAGGFAGYFLKPVDVDTLISALARLPRRRR